MHRIRPVIANDPRYFGRRVLALVDAIPNDLPQGMSADLKLFATTFAAGFLFVSVFIG